jgi:hypothetical protein
MYYPKTLLVNFTAPCGYCDISDLGRRSAGVRNASTWRRQRKESGESWLVNQYLTEGEDCRCNIVPLQTAV